MPYTISELLAWWKLSGADLSDFLHCDPRTVNRWVEGTAEPSGTANAILMVLSDLQRRAESDNGNLIAAERMHKAVHATLKRGGVYKLMYSLLVEELFDKWEREHQ